MKPSLGRDSLAPLDPPPGRSARACRAASRPPPAEAGECAAHLFKQSEMTARLAMMLAGREAELLVLDSVSSGASDDLKRASALAIEMVGSMGLSKSFGLLSVAGVPEHLLGPDIQGAVITEARSLLETSQETASQLLSSHRARLDAIALALLEREALSGEELQELLGAREPEPA